MEKEFMKIRIGATFINIYRKPDSYYASIYGQLPFKFSDEDELEESNMIDLIIKITLTYYRPDTPYTFEVFNPDTDRWLKW